MSVTRDDVFAALHRATAAAGGARLFTVTALDRRAGLARRVWSSHPVEYPVSGVKPLRHDAWSAQVIERGETFVANATPAFAPYFPDHALINALGCGAALNIPVPDGTLVVGTVNLLDVEGHFTSARVARFEALMMLHRSALVAALARVAMAGPP